MGLPLSRSPGLDRLSRASGMTAMGVELTGRPTMLVLAVARPDQPLQLHADVGSEFPLYTSSTGRLVAAWSGKSPSALQSKFEAIEWDRPPKFDEWLREVEEARARGWTIDRDRFKNGITAVAVPVVSPSGELTHTLVAMGLSGSMNAIDIPAMVTDMKQEASLISRQLFPHS